MSAFEGATGFKILNSQLTHNCITHHYHQSSSECEPELAQHLGSLRPLYDLSERCAVDATAESPSTSYAPTCHPETREEVIAGSGKSCIQRKIVDLCWERGVYAASFFFGPQSPKACSEERFVTAIVYQLTQTIPPLKRFVAEAIRNDETIFRKSLEVQIDRLIFDPLESMNPQQALPNVIVVDGLDECVEEKEQAHILRLIQRLTEHEHFPFSVIVASRPSHTIQMAFHSTPLSKSSRILRLDDYCADSDIRKFLQAEFLRLQSTHPCGKFIPPDWRLDKFIDALVKQASGQFLYAAVVIKYLDNTGRSPIVELENIFDVGVSQQAFRDKSRKEFEDVALEDVRANRNLRKKFKEALEQLMKDALSQQTLSAGSIVGQDKFVGKSEQMKDKMGNLEGSEKEEVRRWKEEVKGLLKDFRAQRYPRRRPSVELEQSVSELEHILEVPPAMDVFAELDALYSKILRPPDGEDASLPRMILHTILHARAYPSVTTQSVDILLGLKLGSTDIVLRHWHSIVSSPLGPNASITFHHYSVKDSLLWKIRCGDLYQDEIETKLYLTARYLELSTKQEPNTQEYFDYALSTLMQATSVHWDETFFQDQLIRDTIPRFIEDFLTDVSSSASQETGNNGKWVSALTLMHETTCIFSKLYHQHLCKGQPACLPFSERLWRISHLGDEIVALAEYFELSASDRREMFKKLLDEEEMFERFFDALEEVHPDDVHSIEKPSAPAQRYSPRLLMLCNWKIFFIKLSIGLILAILAVFVALCIMYL